MKETAAAKAARERAALVDEYGRLEAELAPVRPKIRRLEAIRKTIQTWCTAPDDQDQTFAGAAYEVNAGPRKIERRIRSMPAVLAAMGKARFLQVCSVTIENLERMLDRQTAATLLSESRTGSRTLTSYPIAAAAAPVIEMPAPAAPSATRRPRRAA